MTGNPSATGFKARLPNILTIGRIASIPLIVAGIVLMEFPDYSAPAWVGIGTIVLFALACITDYFDGYWARKWNVTSDFGRMIDPIADKLLVAGSLIAICVAINGMWQFMVPALAIIGRDILVSGAREHAALKSRVMPPTKLAKWKTASEMFAIALIIFYFFIPIDIGSIDVMDIGLVVLWLAAALSVYTGSLYLKASLQD